MPIAFSLLPMIARLGKGDSLHEETMRTNDTVTTMENLHQSVLVEEVLAGLALREGETVIDATAGEGGHAETLLSAASIRLIALDADSESVRKTRARLTPFGERASVLEGNFRDIKELLAKEGVSSVEKVLFDLGWNRGQLKAGKGLSFLGDEPLNMSYGAVPASHFTARDILNDWSETAIADVLFGYGGERYARRIAKLLCRERSHTPIETTAQLVALIGEAVPAGYRRGRIHFATRTFQALRIAVNDELKSLERGLRSAWEILSPGGRIAVISFHSVEDALTKRLLREFSEEGGVRITKKPVVASAEEKRGNPSARSAKLRVIEKLSTR
ncbi:MAG: 16S rRNA (cytosine(1402)-N(4))-methyltransferase RsmH [Patescibacteria group bacterium]|nr:16S rRNA (cytosine(1402)-N(4))-methyltransferase RsmH [Patescibacteria group bacterium]